MADQSIHIVLDKELRRDIDAIIQRLKVETGFGGKEYFTKDGVSNWRPSKEREQAVIKLKEAVMWLVEDIAAIGREVGVEEVK